MQEEALRYTSLPRRAISTTVFPPTMGACPEVLAMFGILMPDLPKNYPGQLASPLIWKRRHEEPPGEAAE